MHEASMAAPAATMDSPSHASARSEAEKAEVVSTHVLVEQDKVDLLRELSRRTRIAQSEYLREAVDDLLTKYDRAAEEG